MEEIESANTAKKKKGVRAAVIADVLFFAILLVAVLIVFVIGGQDSRPRVFFDYSMYIVLSGSMQSELPVETFVLVKAAGEEPIEVGDTITFVRQDKKIVTHQVVEVLDDYQNSGMRGFRTKGLENKMVDKEIIYADNVVGKVVYANEGLGVFISYLKSNLWLLALMIGMALALAIAARYLAKTRANKKGQAPKAPPT